MPPLGAVDPMAITSPMIYQYAVLEMTSCASFQKIIWFNTRLFQNRSESPLRNIARVIWYGRKTIGGWIVPKLVTTGSLAVKAKSKYLKPVHNRLVTESAKFTHLISASDN